MDRHDLATVAQQRAARRTVTAKRRTALSAPAHLAATYPGRSRREIDVSLQCPARPDGHGNSRIMLDPARAVIERHDDHARCPLTCYDA